MTPLAVTIKKPKNSYTMTAIALGLGLTLAFSGLAGWAGWTGYNTFMKLSDDEEKVQEVNRSLVQYGESLPMAIRMAATTGEISWKKHYRTMEADLMANLQKAQDLTPPSLQKEGITQVVEANTRRMQIESQAFELMDVGRYEEVLKLLAGKEYEEQISLYTQGTKNILTLFQNRKKSQLETYRQRLITVGLPAAGVLFLTWAGVIIGIRKRLSQHKRIEKTLLSETVRAQEFLDLANVILVVIDTYQKVVLINQRGCSLLGYSQDEIIGKNWFKSFIPVKYSLQLEKKFNEMLDGQIDPDRCFECPVQTKGGKERIISWQNTVLKDETGQVQAVLTSGQDVTERKLEMNQLRSNQEQMAAFLNSIPGVAAIKNAQGQYRYVNKTFESMFGLKKNEWFNKTNHDLFPPEAAEDYNKSDRLVLENRTTLTAIQTSHHEDGNHYWISYKFPIFNTKGIPAMVGGLAVDITESKQMEENLWQANNRLEILLVKSTTDLEETNDKLQREMFDRQQAEEESQKFIERARETELEKHLTKKFADTLVDLSREGIIAFDREFRYTVWNPEMERITGRVRESVLGKYAFDVFPYLKEIGEDKFFQEAIGGRRMVAMNRRYSFGGEEDPSVYEAHYSPLFGEADEIIGGIAVIRDVTDYPAIEEAFKKDQEPEEFREDDFVETRPERQVEDRDLIVAAEGKIKETLSALKQAEAEARQARGFADKLIDSSVDGILAFDNDYRFTVWNSQMEKLSGRARDAVLGQSAFEVFPFLKDMGEDEYFQEALSGKNVVAKDRTYPFSENGDAGMFETQYSPLYGEGNEIIGGIATLRNVTRVSEVEEKLHEAEEITRQVEHEIQNKEQEVRQERNQVELAEQKIIEIESALNFAEEKARETEEALRQAEDRNREMETALNIAEGRSRQSTDALVSTEDKIREITSALQLAESKNKEIETELQRAEDRNKETGQSLRQAQAQMDQARLGFDKLMDHCLDGIMMFDCDFRLTAWNAQMEQLSKRNRQEVVGKSIFDLFPFIKETGEEKYFLEAVQGRSATARERSFAFPGTKEGSIYETHYFPMYGEGEKITGGMAILRDMTDRTRLERQLQEIKDNGNQANQEIQNKENEIEQLRNKIQKAEEQIRESEEAIHMAQEKNNLTQNALEQARIEARQATLFASELINSSVDGIVAFDRDFSYTVWNTEMERVSGRSKESVLGQSAVEVFPIFKENGEQELFKNALGGKTVVANRTYPFLGEGNEDTYEVHYSPLYGVEGEIAGVIAIHRNITEHLQVAEKLIQAKENQNRIEQAFRDKEEEIRRVDGEIRRAKEQVHKAENKSMQSEEVARRSQDHIHRLENEVRHAREFSEQLEHEIRENSEQYRQMFSIDPDALVIIDLETGQFTEFNQSALDLYGYSRDEFMKLQIADLSAETDNPLATFKKTPEGKVSHLGLHYHKKKDGTVMPVEISYGIFQYLEHRFACAVIKDVTIRKQAEEAYGESEQRLKSILDNTQAAIYIKDSQGRYMLINRKYQAMVNVSNEEAKGKTDHDIFPREIADAFRANDQKVLDTLTPLELEEVALHNDGVHIYSSIKFPLRDSVGIPYAVCGIAFDITELKRAETELRKYRDQTEDLAKKQAFQWKASQDKSMQTEKILATSKFAASIARQFGTTLSAVYNVLEHFEERVQLDETHKGLLKLAIKNCAQINALTKKLQNLDLSSSARLVSLDINQALGEMVPQLRKDLLEQKITLESHFAADLPQTAADEEQIQQAVINLIKNAEEAMPDQGGTIKIVTEIQDTNIKIHVQDTGCGIPPENMKLIFDPFFTTKSATKAKGLGLTESYVIIQKLGGHIEVHSQPGRGTTMTLIIPINRALQS